MKAQSLFFQGLSWSKILTVFLVAVMMLAAMPVMTASADTTNYYSPQRVTANGRGWINPVYAMQSDNQYATGSKFNKTLKLTNFFMAPIPGNSTIDGIEIKIEGLTAGKQVDVAVS